MGWADGLRQGWVSGYMRLIPICCCFWGRSSWCGNIYTCLRPTDARSVRCLRIPCCPSRQCTLHLWAQPLSEYRPDAFCLRCYRADLRPGAIVRIDEGAERNLPYLQCVNDGCAISSMLDGELLEQMQLGNQLFVGFRAWGNMETTVIPASLIGFSRAFNTLQ